MPLCLSIKKSNDSIIKSFLYSVRKEVLREMIKKQEYSNIRNGYQERSNEEADHE